MSVHRHSKHQLREIFAGGVEELAAGKSKDQSPSQAPQAGTIFHHAIMNLPASAVEFLDAFRGSFDAELWRGQRLPIVHVYTFARNCEAEEGKSLRPAQPCYLWFAKLKLFGLDG